MNKFMNGLTNANNFTYTENGALAKKSTGSALYDLFAMGAAMRKRSDADVILMFRNAFDENPTYALKCLFYIRDIIDGQGERRFFRLCIRDLATYDTEAMRRNLEFVPMFGRWDDLYEFVGTPLEKEMFNFMKKQLALDVQTKTPSLLGKWLKSINTSSESSRKLGNKTRIAFGMTHRQYRKTLSVLRERINVLERLMSARKWDEIEFDKIPSVAGMRYRNAFARHDVERAKAAMEMDSIQTYADFAKDTTKKVNAKALYPYECIDAAVKNFQSYNPDETHRAMINKYWDNLTDYFNGATLNALAVVDTSASMRGTPINVAISLGLYCAEKAKGPFAGHYVSFSSRPQLIKTEGIDFVDKVQRIWRTNLCENTNIEATFKMLLDTAIKNRCSQEDLPENIIIISDQEFDSARGYTRGDNKTLMENIERTWKAAGYKFPRIIFWNVDARQNNIPMTSKDGISFISGFSPSIFQQVMSGKTAEDLMYEVLNKERYSKIG